MTSKESLHRKGIGSSGIQMPKHLTDFGPLPELGTTASEREQMDAVREQFNSYTRNQNRKMLRAKFTTPTVAKKVNVEYHSNSAAGKICGHATVHMKDGQKQTVDIVSIGIGTAISEPFNLVVRANETFWIQTDLTT